MAIIGVMPMPEPVLLAPDMQSFGIADASGTYEYGDRRNELFGEERVGFEAHWRAAHAVGHALIERGIGTIVDKPPGIEQFKIPGAARKRNWLKMAPKIKRKGNAVEIADRVLAQLASPVDIGREVSVTASVGIAARSRVGSNECSLRPSAPGKKPTLVDRLKHGNRSEATRASAARGSPWPPTPR